MLSGCIGSTLMRFSKDDVNNEVNGGGFDGAGVYGWDVVVYLCQGVGCCEW